MIEVLLLGSIGVLAETSEIQRNAYNQAFEDHGLDWYWNVANYCALLKRPGGKRRLVDFANGKISAEMIDSIHDQKERLFSESLKSGLKPRAGVTECINACKDKGIKIGLITTTSQHNIDTLSEALRRDIDFSQFDLITTKKDVDQEKPSGDVYQFALSQFSVAPDLAIAVEDTEVNQQAALEHQILCYLFAGEYATTEHHFNAVKSLTAISNRL